MGPRLYDVADFVCSVPRLSGRPELRAFIERRVARLAELLGFDRREILGLAQAQAVLSGWWSYEDHGRGWETAFALAELLGS